MNRFNTTTIMPDRERGQHLKFEDRCTIKIYRKHGYSLRGIAKVIDCSPSTVMYELRRGTGERNGNRGRFPEYSAKRGQANYKINRSRCHKPHKIDVCRSFINWAVAQVKNEGWTFDICVGRARKLKLFPKNQIPCTKTLYNELWAGNLPLSPFDLPEALSRKRKRCLNRQNKRILGRSIEERPEEASLRTVCGHWEIDTVVGHRSGKESVVLTLVEKKTDYYLAIKIPGKDSNSVMDAMEVLREEYGVGVFFAHPYSSWERPQNERHNRMFRRYIPKGISIDNYSAQQILKFADEMNALPRRVLEYSTPEELFDEFLDWVYSIDKDRIT